MNALALTAARVLPAALALPLGPWPLRLVAGLPLAVAVAVVMPIAMPHATTSQPREYVPLLFVEATIGLALGLSAAALLAGAQAAGALLDSAARSSLALGWRGWRGGPFARLWLLLALAVFAAAGGPALTVEALARSYEALPPGAPPAGGVGATIEAVSRLLLVAVTLAAPILAAMLVAEVGVGLIERAAPSLARQLSPVPGGGTARMIAVLLAIVLSAGAAAVVLGDHARAVGRDVLAAARLLAGR